MSLTEAERKRLYRQKQRELQSATLKHATEHPSYLSRPFSEFVRERMPDFALDENLDAFGVQIAGRDFLTADPQDFPSQFEREEPLSALQRAMGLVDTFIEAAQELAHLINVYKLEEVMAAIDRATEASMGLPRDDIPALKASFAEIDRLTAIQTELRKPTRHTVLGIRAKLEGKEVSG